MVNWANHEIEYAITSAKSHSHHEDKSSLSVSQKLEQNNMIVKNPASDVSPPVPPRPAKPSFFLPQGENKPSVLSKFRQSNWQNAQDTGELTEQSVKSFTTCEHMNKSMSLLAAPTPASTPLSRANVQDRFVLSNPQSP